MCRSLSLSSSNNNLLVYIRTTCHYRLEETIRPTIRLLALIQVLVAGATVYIDLPEHPKPLPALLRGYWGASMSYSLSGWTQRLFQERSFLRRKKTSQIFFFCHHNSTAQQINRSINNKQPQEMDTVSLWLMALNQSICQFPTSYFTELWTGAPRYCNSAIWSN